MRSERILFLPSQPTGMSPVWAMTRFILPESLIWLITCFFSWRQTQPGAFLRALKRRLPTASQKDRPLPCRGAPQVQPRGERVRQHRGDAWPSCTTQLCFCMERCGQRSPGCGEDAVGPWSRLGTGCRALNTTARHFTDHSGQKHHMPQAGEINSNSLGAGWQSGMCSHLVPKASLLPGELWILKTWHFNLCILMNLAVLPFNL